MTSFDDHETGWIVATIDQGEEAEARRMRAKRDQRYRNIFVEASTDERWIGDLAEIVFNQWLRSRGIGDFEWVIDHAAGKADFVLANGTAIGVKAVKRKVPPKMEYTAQITAKHADEPIDQFFFMTYEIARRQMWMLGGASREFFLEHARFYGPGEWVHKYYQVRPGHEIYNIEISRLSLPVDWLEPLR